MPRILGVLLIIGAFGYLIDSFTFFLLPNNYEPIFGLLDFGELLLGLWLLIKGVDAEQWEKRAVAWRPLRPVCRPGIRWSFQPKTPS
ncbi:MAG TPA: DUF4386 family protein [Anaerolineae bacterium]|nr:DUF4386 family protein [Anaerolineae bacterium]